MCIIFHRVYIKWVAMKKKVCQSYFVRKRDPGYIPVRKFSLSKAVADVLLEALGKSESESTHLFV